MMLMKYFALTLINRVTVLTKLSSARKAQRMILNLLIMVVVTSVISLFGNQSWAVDSPFVCGGKIEKEAWGLWDKDVKKFLLERQLQDRLLKQGDVYALYDFQTYTHNLLAMARRCNSTSRLQEIARLIEIAYGKLEPAPTVLSGRRWVCRGGSICNESNRLLNNEVLLDSVQFLGVASSVANALASSKTQLTDDDKLFIKNTVQIIIEHLLRWSDKTAINAIQKARVATILDVKDGSSALFFTDKPLWMISIYAELSGILNSPQLLGIPQISPSDKTQLSRHLNELLQFFRARLSIQRIQNSQGKMELADLDRGYWRLFADNAYAGYEKAEKPVTCVYSSDNKNKFKIVVAIPADKVPKREDLGWDISHARRLVHALDALERNRPSVKKIFMLGEEQLPPDNLTNAFANTLVSLVWNGNKHEPLFSNYWNGANGWYRVAHGSGTGQCREGTPPFGLTDSFPTGGYVAWVKYNPTVGELGKRLYYLINSTKAEDTAFVARYYAHLGTSAKPLDKSLTRILFLPSLVGVSIQ